MKDGKITSVNSISEMRTLAQLRDRDAEVRSFQREYGVFGDVEKRTFAFNLTEMRESGTLNSGVNDGTFQIKGTAAVFGKPSVEMRSQFGDFIEFIDPHAFDKVLRTNPPVILTWDHDSRYPLGSTENRTLELSVDGNGLQYWSRVAPTSYAADLKVLMEGGYLSQSSFLFRVAPGGDEWNVTEDTNGNDVVSRTIFEVGGLFDLCVCCAGAYPDTTSGIARTLAFSYGIDIGQLEPRKAIPYKETPKAADGTAWDAGTETKGATADDLMAMCAWYDPTKKDADGNLTAGAFKLPHHNNASSYPVVWAGVKAAMSRLNQSNTQIPDSDRQGVYNHLKKHYAQFEQTAPELRSRVDIEAESRRVTDELRALGDVIWTQEEGVEELEDCVECLLNAENYYCPFSVIDVSTQLNKVLVCDWSDYTYWVVPFELGVDDMPVISDQSEWQQVETAWVTTNEGYEANMQSAKQRRESRMSDENNEAPAEGVETPEEVVTPEVEEVVTPETDEETPTVDEPEVRTPDASKVRLLAEARARLARSKTV